MSEPPPALQPVTELARGEGTQVHGSCSGVSAVFLATVWEPSSQAGVSYEAKIDFSHQLIESPNPAH